MSALDKKYLEKSWSMDNKQYWNKIFKTEIYEIMIIKLINP